MRRRVAGCSIQYSIHWDGCGEEGVRQRTRGGCRPGARPYLLHRVPLNAADPGHVALVNLREHVLQGMPTLVEEGSYL